MARTMKTQEELLKEFELMVESREEEFDLVLQLKEDEELEDQLWKARTGLNDDTLCGAIETIIFMSDRPISLAKIKSYIDEEIPLRVLHEAIAKLQKEYEQVHHGVRLMEVAEGYQLRTKATYSKYVQDLFKVSSLVLSPTALEVLAIISYKQPVSKVEVEKIRGVDSSHIVRGLMDKRLVKVCGRSDEAGRPVLYGTTSEFLEVFNLKDISELPPEYELESMLENSIGKISDIKSIVNYGDKTRFYFDEMDELDQLSHSIKSIDPNTPFTKSLIQEERKRVTEEGIVRKSAFELLEEHLDHKLITDQNSMSVLSELLIPGVDPSVVSDPKEFDKNAPSEEDEFSMVDVETGEEIDETPVEAETVEESLSLEDSEDVQDIMADQNEMSRDELSAALDQAFENLVSTELDEIDSNHEEETQELSKLEDEIDEITDSLIQEGEELDLDLDFLKQNNVDNSQVMDPHTTLM